MVEYASSRLLDEPLKAAIAQLDDNVAEGRRAASRRVIGEEVTSEGSLTEVGGVGGFSKQGVAPRPLLREGEK